ncbi:ankyrin [Thozetella sp. PMI_491]|nr:ankyrin [Thozetella sp. PMI_491]
MYPLHYATELGERQIIEELLACGADADVRDGRGRTALRIAQEKDMIDMLELLLRHGANPNLEDMEQHALLWHAARDGSSPQMLEILLEFNSEHRSINYESQDPEMPTALWAAAASGHLDIARRLLAAGASVETKDRRGRTLLHRADWLPVAMLTPFLLDRGANVWAKDDEGCLPLHRAAAEGLTNMTQAILERMDADEDVAAADVKDAKAKALLHAAQNGSIQLVSCLINKWQTPVSVHDSLGNGALYYACANGHDMVAAYLAGQGANLDAKNTQDDTPLHAAVRRGNTSLVRMLLQLGANVETETRQDLPEGIAQATVYQVGLTVNAIEALREIERFGGQIREL